MSANDCEQVLEVDGGCQAEVCHKRLPSCFPSVSMAIMVKSSFSMVCVWPFPCIMFTSISSNKT